MRMDELTVDVEKIEEGGWVDNIPEMGSLRIKTRGIDNKQWRKQQARLTAALPRNKKDDPDERERIFAILLRDTALIDWDGIEDSTGKAVPFSKEQANEYLTDPKYNRRFLYAALYAATTVAEQNRAEIEDDAKN